MLRKGSTEERTQRNKKNLTLARSRIQVACFSSADAITNKPRVLVAGPEFFILIGFQTLNSLSCLPFMWTFYTRHVT